jgi:hypothetical protein
MHAPGHLLNQGMAAGVADAPTSGALPKRLGLGAQGGARFVDNSADPSLPQVDLGDGGVAHKPRRLDLI